MDNEPVHEGGCTCGALRYRVSGEPIYVNNCHCRQCQNQTGSTSVVNAFFETGRLTLLSGSVREHEVKAGSGGPHRILRCAACGTAIWSHYPRAGRLGLGLRVGTLDDCAAFRPDAAIFVSERMPWVTLPEGIPAFERYYDPHVLIPAQRYARMEALLERRKAGEG
ncbi:MAG: GFA family protein [Sphingomonadales bacterium]|nr:GFA family protein [Sphingomonadales bacterium]